MKRLRLGLTVVLAMILLLVVAVPVTGLAAEEVQTGNPVLTKWLLVPAGVPAVPASSYEFEFTPKSVQDSSETPPTISDWKISFDGSEALKAPTPETGGYYYAEKNSDDVLTTTFPHAGVYVYWVTEKAGGGTPPATGTITPSAATYEMKIYVKNGSTGPEIDAIVFHTVTDTSGEGTIGVKAPPIFANTYALDTTFRISKAVTGPYADLTKPFAYTLTLTAAPGAAAGTIYTGSIYNADNTPSTTTVDFTLSGSGTLTATNTFNLTNGQYLLFDGANGSTVLPVGTTYTLVETGVPGYLPSVSITGDPAATITPDPLEKGEAANVEGLLMAGTNTVAFTNEYQSASPTGVFMDNLPFILLILVAVGGIVAYLAVKRRKAHSK